MGGMTAAFVRAVRQVVGLPADPTQSPDIMRLGLWRATVVSQNADGTYEVQPEDPRISGGKNVKVLSCLPGLDLNIKPGAVVRLGWTNGNPKDPFVMPTHETGAGFISMSFGDAAEEVITKSDFAALLSALGAATAGGNPLTFGTPPLPTDYGATSFKVQR